MPDTVLLIVHQKKSVPGHIGHLFKERGYEIDRRCPCLGDELPEELEAYAAVAIFGGPMSANDCWMPGIKAELDFVPKVLEAEIPFLGLCLGGQILARVLGADVRPHADGHIESGYTRIYPTEAGREWFAESDIFYQWHREGFDTPSTATLIAKGDIFQTRLLSITRVL